MTNTIFYLIRHGETEWNVAGRLQGHSDSPLTEQGLAQVRARAKSLRHIRFAAFYSSDLLRALRTAEIIALHHGLSVVSREELRERHFGQYEGYKIDDYKQQLQEQLAKRRQLVDDQLNHFELFTGYETDEKLATRFTTILQQLTTSHLGQTVGVVTHGEVLRVLLRWFGYASQAQLESGEIHNVAYVKIELDDQQFRVIETEGVKLTK